MAIDEGKLEQFVHKALGDMAGAFTAGQVVLGDKLGLYRAMAEAGPISSSDLASRTGLAERYVREWLRAQAAGGYVAYDVATDRYELPPEQAEALTNEDSVACVLGGFQVALAALRAEPKLSEAFRGGHGVGWHEHDPGLFDGTRRFFRPGYMANIVSAWLPALDGVEERLRAGGRVADVGCGLGASTIIMARAFPASAFVGFDYHEASIDEARAIAAAEGLRNVAFEVASAKSYPGAGYDLVTFFDCLHDMGDPVGASRHVLQTLAPTGAWMLVEPYAGDRVEENLHPLGRLFYSASTFVCTPAALSQEGGLALGAQAGEARLRDVLTEAGFGRVRRAAATPFNLILEARP